MKKNFGLLGILILLAFVAGVIFYLKDDGSIMSGNPLANFAVDDTASIDKIFIADPEGRTVLLERNPEKGLWRLNGTYDARADNIELLLRTFKNIEVKGPVPKNTQPQVLRTINSNGKKVEIYVKGELHKTYYVGTPTPDHAGTYMLLEDPEEGRSTEPFIMQMKGFSGFLSTRFFTNEEDWRHTGIFNYPNLNFAEVAVQNHQDESQSFSVRYGGGNDLRLRSTLLDQDVNNFDTSQVKEFLLFFKIVHFETFNSGLSPAQEDSVFRTQPCYTISVTELDGDRKSVDLYWKQNSQGLFKIGGDPYEWDADHLYGAADGSDLVLCQRYTFDPLMQPLTRFLKLP